MTTYRVGAPPRHPDAPELPTAAQVVTAARRELSICIALGSGVVAWLLLARVAWLAASSPGDVPWSDWPRGLLFALPVLVWTPLLAGRVAHVSLETGVVPADTLLRSAGAGAVNGLLFGATYAVFIGISLAVSCWRTLDVGSIVTGIGLGALGTILFGIFAMIVSVPLGFLFGLSYALVLGPAAALAARPSIVTIPATAALGARHVTASALVALALEGGVGGETHGACALTLLGTALVVVLRARATRRQSEALRARIHAGQEVGLTLVPLEATDASGAIRLELDPPPDAAVVSRTALATEEQLQALALTSWSLRHAGAAP